MTAQIRVVMADDHPIVREGLRGMIQRDASLQVIAEAGDGASALELIERHRPEVAVLDVDMPGMDGFAVAREIGRRRLGAGVVFLTLHKDPEIFHAAMELGVKGYVLKDSYVTDIAAAIKAVAAGRPYISPELSGLLLERRRRSEELGRERPGLHLLTPTERRVLRAVAEEKSSREIADALGISHRTVETHRSNICAKLGLSGSHALVKFALTRKSEL